MLSSTQTPGVVAAQVTSLLMGHPSRGHCARRRVGIPQDAHARLPADDDDPAKPIAGAVLAEPPQRPREGFHGGDDG